MQPINQNFKAGFDGSNTLGKLGEGIVKEFLNKMFPKFIIEDTSDNPDYQFKDIDFLFHNPFNNTTKTVEVKTDMYDWSPNFAVETWANFEIKRRGWIHTSDADVLAYYFINGLKSGEPNLWFIDLAYLRNLTLQGKFREVDVVPEQQLRNTGTKTTKVTLVPRKAVTPLSTYSLTPMNVKNPHSAQGKR